MREFFCAKIKQIAGSANGRQAGSEPVNLGPTPSPAAIRTANLFNYFIVLQQPKIGSNFEII